MSKTKTIICSNCNNSYELILYRYTERIARGNKNFFCNRKCFIEHLRKQSPNCNEEFLNKPIHGPYNYKEFSGIMRQVRSSFKKRKIQSDLTYEDLSEIWKNQNGICRFTGVKLILPNNSTSKSLYLATLDRIDSSLGYTKYNVHFVSIMINYAKCDFTLDELIVFCKAISEENWRQLL